MPLWYSCRSATIAEPSWGRNCLNSLNGMCRTTACSSDSLTNRLSFCASALAHEVEALFLGQLADLGEDGLREQIAHLAALGPHRLLPFQALLAVADEPDHLVEVADQGGVAVAVSLMVSRPASSRSSRKLLPDRK